MNKKDKVLIVIFTIVLFLFTLISSISVDKNNYNYLVDNINQDSDTDDNTESVTYEEVNYEEIINSLKTEYQNDDIVGIFSIENTDFKVPLLQGKDNNYYLNHTPDGEENFMGSIYLDYRVDIDSSRKLLIFGHNSSRIDMPFKILEEFYDIDYLNNHKYVSITTTKMEKRYEIFSIFVETSDFSYMNINFNSDEEYYNHLIKLKEKSMYDTGVEISKDDEILLLQTCSTHKDYINYAKKYLLIILRRV